MNSRRKPIVEYRASFRRCRNPLLLLVVVASGCDWPGLTGRAATDSSAQQAEPARMLYRQHCAGCHGADGRLGPAPPLNDHLFIALVPDAELLRVVAEGRPGTMMPAFSTSKGGALSSEQIRMLADDIKVRWGRAEAATSGAPPYLVDRRGAGGSGNREHGIKAFARACACCHGDQGQGGRYGGKEDGPVVGAIDDADFLALTSDQALRRLVITGRPDLGMPNFADASGRPAGYEPLLPQEVTDIVALLADWRQRGGADGKEN